MIIEPTDVELLSIKMKSKQDIDNEIDENARVNDKSPKFSPLNRSSYLGSSSHVPEENDDDDHYESSLRLLAVDMTANGICGFHLTRTKWDPYPWVSAVDRFTPAEKSGLKAGECVLEVNGCDVLGLRITEIANMVKSCQHQVTLLLWSTKCNSSCEEEGLCAAPLPRSMQRLSAVVQCVLSVIECPVCLDTITPPAMQCQNGHLLCVNCRIRAENCPVCRDRYYPRPALIAEQLQAAITSAFDLCRNEDKVRQKIFGRHHRQQQMVKTSLECLTRTGQVHKSSTETAMITLPDNKILPKTELPIASTANNGCEECVRRHAANIRVGKRNKPTTACNKLLTKLLNFKTYSMENLTNVSSTPLAASGSGTATPPEITKSALSSHPTQAAEVDTEVYEHQQQTDTTRKYHQYERNQRYTTNQLEDDFNATNVVRPKQLLSMPVAAAAAAVVKPIVNNDLSMNSNPQCCKQMSGNRIEHFSLSSSDLTMNNQAIMSPTNIHCVFETTITTSSLPVATTTIRKNSPGFFSRRPCQNSAENLSQSIPRALKLSTNNLVKSQILSTNSHLGSVNPVAFAFDDISFEMSKNSTPSTVSLKSSTSLSSISHLNLATNLCSLEAKEDAPPLAQS